MIPLPYTLLHQYQRDVVNSIVHNRATFGILDMGLGKTVSTLTAIAYMQSMYNYRSALIFAPLRVCYSVWPEEIKRWKHTKDMKCHIVHGKGKGTALSVDADIYVANYESLDFVIDVELWKQCDILVLDESSYVKSHKTKRYKLLKTICMDFKKVVLLTGTPSGSGKLWELFSQTYLLDGGERFGKSYHWFKKKYYQQVDYHGYQWDLKPGSDQKIKEKIRDISIVFRAKDHLKLPPLMNNTVTVTMPKKSMDIYKELESEFLYQFAEDQAITVANAAVLSGKLRQVCAGGLYIDDTGKWEALHEEKVNALEEIVESTDSPVLCFFWFRFEKEMILKKFKKASFIDGDSKPGDVQAVVNAWNNKDIKLLCCHPASAGHGLNLQSGSGIMVWLTLTWSLEQYQQAIARLYRQGQTETCIIHHIVCKDSVDEAVIAALGRKNKGQQSLIDELKKYSRKKI